MRELNLFEINAISGAEKSVSDMTPSDYAPFVAGYFAAEPFAKWTSSAAGSLLGNISSKTLFEAASNLVYYGSIGLGAVGTYLGAKFICEQVKPYLD